MTDHAEAALDRLIQAIGAGDPDAARAAYHPDATIWHNYDQIDQSVDENLRTLSWLITSMPERRYEDVVRRSIEGGVVQQHVLRGANALGTPVEMPACLFAFVDDDGLITRIEEYVDTAQSQVLWER
ncbi:MAG: nuclear transport factor 2 family protein [Acidimicrobiales bacterium]